MPSSLNVGLVRSQLDPLIAESADPNERLDRMLDRLGIDVARLPIETLRSMTWTCMNCDGGRHCRQWLSANKGPDFHTFVQMPRNSTMPCRSSRQRATGQL